MKKTKKGLLIVHIDGLSYTHLLHALHHGYMPYLARLMKTENYEVLKYRSGLPSTTPFAQAGILYGDNDNIPSFKWWDKEAGVLVKFGALSTFKHVEHKYFKNAVPITKGGACIAACFPGGARETFATAYKSYKTVPYKAKNKRLHLLLRWGLNPLHVIDWLYSSAVVILRLFLEYIRAFLQGKTVSQQYFLGNMLYEIFFHHLTRYAVNIAIKQRYPVIYTAIYTYDEASHGFGPNDFYTYRALREVDNSLRYIAKRRENKKNNFLYELLILSDHGQVQTVPFHKHNKKRFAEILSTMLPHYKIVEEAGATIRPKSHLDGQIVITYSGGIAHLYFKTQSWRLDYREINKQFPKLLSELSAIKELQFIMVKDGVNTVLIKDKQKYMLSNIRTKKTYEFLIKLDAEPELLAKELQRLNSFSRSGDIILFGAKLDGNRYINFESQSGGHGAIGGEQMYPFIFSKKDWNLKKDKLHSGIAINKSIKRIIASL